MKAKPLGSQNVFSGSYQSQAQRQDRSYFKRLYNFNANVELAEFSLPFELSGQNTEGAGVKTMVNGEQLGAEEQRAAQMQMEYDQMEGQRQVLYDMDGNEILEDEYGNEMDDVMDPEYGEEQNQGEQGEDDLKFEEFEALIDQQEDENSNKIAELRAANYVGSKGTPMWHLRNSIKTGEQAVSFFAKYGSNMPIKFLNCNRKEVGPAEFRPYDLDVAKSQDPKELDLEYFTVSAQGVVQVFNDKNSDRKIRPKNANPIPTEFLSLPEWMQQSTMFNVLSSMKFFKHYLIGKVFRLWTGNVRKRMYNRTREDLSKNLIFARPDFLAEFMNINKVLYEMQSRLTFKVENKAQPYELDKFMEIQHGWHDESKIIYRAKVDEEIKSSLVALTKKISDSRTLREEEDLENSKKGKAEKKKSITAAKSERILKNQVLHLARNNYKSLGTFIRLIDYRVVEAQVRINQESAEYILSEMENEQKKYAIITQVQFDTPEGMNFLPDKSAFKTSIDKLLFEMKSAVEDIQPINLHSDLQQFINGLITDTAPRFSYIVDRSYNYRMTKKTIEDHLSDDFNYLEKETEKFEECRSVYEFEQTFQFEDFVASESAEDLDYIKTLFEKWISWEQRIQRYIQQYTNKGLLRADGKKLRDGLQAKVKETLALLRTHLYNISDRCYKQVDKSLNKIKADIKKDNKNLEQYVLFVRSLKEAEETLKECELSKLSLESMKMNLQKYRDRDQSTSTIGGQSNVQTLQQRIESIQTEIESLTEELKQANIKAEVNRDANLNSLTSEIDKQKANISEQIDQLDNEVLTRQEVATTQALSELAKIKKKFDGYSNKVKEYQENEDILSAEKAKVEEIELFEVRYNKKFQLWNNRNTFGDKLNEWYFEPFLKQDCDKLVKDVQDLQTQNMAMKMKLRKGEKDDVLMKFDEEVSEVYNKLELIKALGQKDLQDRHWSKIFKQMESNLEQQDRADLNLNQIFDAEAMDHLEFIQEVAGTAKGEADISAQMDEVEKRWATREFFVANYRDTKDRFIIKEVEDVITELEDDIMTVSAMLGSRYVNEIRAKVEDWESKLAYLSDCIDEWLTFQRQWMYLENIFNAEDIQTQLKAETKQFQQVDKFWKDHMTKAKKDAKVISQYDSGRVVLKKFVENNQRLEEIQKGLEDYLGTKRGAFPRFYFLSNDDLIEILSQTRNVQAVQPHLMKCFDAMKKIEFTTDKNSKEIIGMWSPEGEYVEFSDSVMAIGPVETWLKNIESMMTQSLYDQSRMAVQQYPEDITKRDKWLFDYPAQPVLTIDMVMWTKGVEEAINEIQSGLSESALKEWLVKTNGQLDAMIVLVRGDLTALQRAAMGALLVLDVHNQFIVEQMIKSGLNNMNDFLWTQQLRYYWEKLTELDGDPFKGDVGTDLDCFCKQTNTRFRYGYEYLGNGPRLVITPLTDKCYMTLTGALHSNYGGNPQGPAGTGKTETTKDLAKALAIQCVVFNCGDGLDVRMMARFFTGLASGGAWSCFDEFNRIFIEVLSVIAQQILTIQSAVKERKVEFFFDDKQIPLNLRFGVFITMNPGYAGRTELPDNLNALFRPISMMIPDYGLIAQIYLFADGFAQANDLSKKMVKLYSLSSEQLSKQDHYDFGMRAVKSVLVMAGKLRRKSPDSPEDELLIRAMRDSNVPKFLEQDLPLFEGIITDLFPTSSKPNIDNARLEAAIRTQLDKEKYIYVEKFKDKIIQLLETMTVRHGNMLVGSTGTGKTTCAKILGRALQQLHEDGHRDDPFFQPVEIRTLNPKAVRMGELFGENNVFTNEWKEGIVSKLVKDAVQALEGPDSNWKRWINFDGPVDALWIENMNTVLDDNKMLCLNNGQRIRMPDTCTMMFEVNDLKVASPATVSRCGMVYLEPVHLGWRPLVETWTKKMEGEIDETQLPRISTMIIAYLDKLLFKVSKMKQAIKAEDSNLVASCLRLVTIFLNKQAIKLDAPDIDADRVVNNYVAFSMIWSIGANVHDSERTSFGVSFKRVVEEYVPDFDTKSDIYDQGIDTKTHKFQKWDEQITEHYVFDPKQDFFQILVPTNDTVKYKFLLGKILMNGHNALVMGETGVGKSVIVKNFLMNAPEKLLSAEANFSGKTSTANLVDAIEGNLDALRKNMLQPKAGKKMVFFIDDVNMPQLDRYFSQPPCELLRQIIDQGGYYDVDKLFFKHVRETKFVAACAPPSGGRNPVSPRLFRHFNMLWVPELSAQSMKQIFSQILKGFLAQKEDQSLATNADMIIKAAVEIYQNVINDFLPTPTKCHYTFNLRDLSKVVQGMLMCDGKVIEDKEYLVKLYICETYRVFRDRLIDEKDRQKFSEDSHEVIENYLNLDWELKDFENVIFGDFDNSDSYYMKLGSVDELRPKLQDLLTFFNMQPHNTPMDLVFFEDCVQHLARIARILKQQRGNAMLVGVGGSGRRSMAMFGASFNRMHTFQIEITKTYSEKDWHENIRDLLKKCALEDQIVQFLFSDTQIVFESFLEDINNLLNSGVIPNLFGPEDKTAIYDELLDRAKAAGVPPSKDAVMAYFTQLCRQNMHIVLAFSPVGDAFRDRCRQFPSIINCATIDWYNAWPEDALYSVAYRKYNEKAESLEIQDDLEVLAKASVTLHMSVREESEAFYDELRRNNYVTPTSYLALVKVFLSELNNQRAKIPVQIMKYENGLLRLDQTNIIVDQLKKNLETLQPEIEEKEKATQEMVIVLQEKDKVAKEKEKITSVEAAEAGVLFKKVKDIKDDCDAELSVAMPALEKAIKALDTLKESDIGEMKGYVTPPPALVLVMDAVALLLGHGPGWKEAVKVMAKPKDFIAGLKAYNKDNIKESVLKKLKKFVNNPEFDPELIKQKSVAAKSICMWCRAMDTYAAVNKIVIPKKKALGEAEAQLSVVKKELDVKEAALREIKAELARLQADYSRAQQQLDQLSRDKKKIELQLERAEKLVVGLADEALRWKQSIESLNEDKSNMLGNTVLAAGYLAYVGCFTQEYRVRLVKRWMKFLREQKMKFSPDWSLQKILGDSLKIRTWNIQGLPADDLSIDNGIITTYPDSRWPLIIDPQTQGNRWIKNKEKDNSLKIIKLSQPKFLLTIETSIKMGFSVLLENIGETLDPSLEPILTKNIIRKNNQNMIKIGDTEISYHNDFLFFLTTKLSNPHYLPEICIKVTLLNFTVTPQGLEDQLLVQVIQVERPELELQKDNNIISLADCNRQLKDTEARILKMVSEAGEDILEDEELILTLDQSKQTAIAIGERKAEAEITAAKINVSREKYRTVARRGSVLYFVISNLALINEMYQYSLEFFNRLFRARLEKSEAADEIEDRLRILIDDITKAFYLSICRGLFERDKLLYSFLNTAMILRRADRISLDEWNGFLRGSVTDFKDKENPVPDYLDNKMWWALWGLEEMHPNFKDITSSVADVGDKPIWKEIVKSETPWTVDMPAVYEARLTPFQKTMVLNILKNTKLMGSIKEFVRAEVGPFYIESPPFDLEGCLEDSSNITPVIFVLSPGADPIAYLKQLAVAKGMDKKLESISLGQGQDVIAEKLIEEGSRAGNWVCLQNCHLFTSWMPKLEVIQERADPQQMHPEYRLWLTSNPSTSFPVPVLQSGVKLTNEPPRGLKAGISRTFTDLGQERYEVDFNRSTQYKKLVFALAFFHSVILERRKYGPIGWNVQYSWMNSDFDISEKNLMQYLETQETVPYVALNFIVAQVNYGGRVTDKQDVRVMSAMLKKYFCAELMQEGYKFSALDTYFAPPGDGTFEDCMNYITTLPLDENPEVFGLHSNANIAYETALVKSFIDTILIMQPRVAGGKSAATPEQIVNNKTLEFLNMLPEIMDWGNAHPNTKKDIKEGVMNSLGVFVKQEMERFNKLLKVVKANLNSLVNAIKGTEVMSQVLEDIFNCFINNKVPDPWMDNTLGFPSLKPLDSWMQDLVDRIEFIGSWVTTGPPNSFWIGSFFFPQGFMTATMQTYARATGKPIDTLGFTTHVLDLMFEEVDSRPEIGVYMHGLIIQGAKWDAGKKSVEDSDPKVPFVKFPVIWLEPVETTPDSALSPSENFECPLYKTSARKGELSTTGHSTNFVMMLDLPSKVHQDYWIRRGAALLCMTDD